MSTENISKNGTTYVVDEYGTEVTIGWVKGVLNIWIEIKQPLDYIKYNKDGININIVHSRGKILKSLRIQQTISKDIKTSLEDPGCIKIHKDQLYSAFDIILDSKYFWSKEKAEKKIKEFEIRDKRIAHYKEENERNRAIKAEKKRRKKEANRLKYHTKKALANKKNKKKGIKIEK